MHIINLHSEAIAVGKASFNLYLAAVICGPASKAYLPGMVRNTGIGMIAGGIAACIEHGLTTRDEILNAVARASHCARTTVATVLDELTGGDRSRHLWDVTDGKFRIIGASATGAAQPRLLLAA